MRIVPNLGPTFRVIYVLLGVGLIVGPFVFLAAGWERVVLPILGAMAVVTGATGW